MERLISILHPSRGRAQKSIQAIEKWVENARFPFELIVSIDEDDPVKDTYIRDYSARWLLNPNFNPAKKIIVNNNRSAVDAINNAAKESTGSIMVVVSDDTACPYYWDEKIIEATRGREDFVLRVNDEIQRWIITMPVIDRKYYDRFGYIYYPEYKHMFCDTEFTHVANLLGRVIHRNDLHFPHNHYSVRKATKDALNERCDATWNEGQALYIRRFKESFGLSGVDCWNISDERHKHWINQKL